MGGTAGRKVGGLFFAAAATSSRSYFGKSTSFAPMLMANVRQSVSP